MSQRHTTAARRGTANAPTDRVCPPLARGCMMLRRTRLAWIAALCLASVAPVSAEVLAIVGGQVYLPDGPAEGVTVLLDQGRITAVGPAVSIPPDAAVIDASGKVVTAGLIEAYGRIGLTEVGAEPSTVDFNQDEPGDPFRPALMAAGAYNPRSSVIAVARSGGLTSAVSAPSGGIVPGQGSWVDLTGLTQAEAVVAPSVALYLNFRSGEASRNHVLYQITSLLEEARAWPSSATGWLRGQSQPFTQSRLDLSALQPVLSGQLPVVVSTDRAADIEAMLRLAESYGLKIIIQGGAEAHLMAGALAEAQVPVIVDPFVYGPGGFDQLRGREDNAALLRAAGVTVVIAGLDRGNTHHAARLRQLAGNAVRAGMDHTQAIQAITQAPAEVFGMVGYGRIEVGAVANIVVWSGDPLEISEHAEHVIVHGQDLPRVSRHTALLERYRELPGSPLPALTLPGVSSP